MSSLNIIGYTKDCRTSTHVVYAEITVSDYLKLVGDDFDRFEIQRKRQDPKKYKRLKTDIKNGALMPTITLAINPNKVDVFLKDVEGKKSKELIEKLQSSLDIFILDGLQRTYIIKDLSDEETKFVEGQKILLEIWFEGKIEHLIYRLIVLNSGQKPMSMRHQVELLFTTLKDEIEQEIPDLDIYLERENKIRSQSLKFSFDRIVNAYYSFLTKSPEIDRDNLIVKKLNEDDILSSNESELNSNYNSFIKYFKLYCKLDSKLYGYYSNTKELSSFKNWLAEENTLKGFFAAVARNVSNNKSKRVDDALDILLASNLIDDNIETDPFRLDVFKEIKSGIDSKKFNVGNETRKLIMDGFREYFMDAGESSFSECWRNAAR